MSVLAKKELGQHWLVDANIVRVAGRLAELGPDDVVLEIGPGLGILTAFLADHARFVHTVELDRSLAPALEERLGARENVRLVYGDAVTLALHELEPPPAKLVANLPYQIATPLLVESLDGLPTVRRWCVMVQREVADRLFAAPATKPYGSVSVLVQLTAEQTGFHSVSRSVFRPPPKVDSALVAFRRTRDWGGEFVRVKAVVQAAFAHRRKTLANSLALARVAERENVERALVRLGHDAGVRAEALAPAELERLALAL